MLCEICGKLFVNFQQEETMCASCEWLSCTPLERVIIFTKETNERMYNLTQG
jgi:hypothetical protein